MTSEIIRCNRCRSEVEYFYDDDNTVVKVTPCLCTKTEVKKLDQALNELSKFKQRRKYEKSNRRPN